MTATEVSIQKTKEFIDDAQEIIARTKDLMAALNKLTSKNVDVSLLDPKQLAQQARLEEEMNALIQRHFPSSAALTPNAGAENGSSSSQNDGAVRPGRFRPHI